jgi:hypothetical protein
MALNKPQPLDERIKSICAEAVVDAKAAELKKLYEGLPITWLRRDLDNKAPGCVCKQALAFLRKVNDNGACLIA